MQKIDLLRYLRIKKHEVSFLFEKKGLNMYSSAIYYLLSCFQSYDVHITFFAFSILRQNHVEQNKTKQIEFSMKNLRVYALKVSE